MTESIVILAVLTLSVAIVVCWKIRCRLEKWAIFIIANYLISSVLRVISWALYVSSSDEDEDVEHFIDLIDEIAVILTWTMLYFFIFEMKDLKDKLESHSPKIYARKQQFTKRIRAVAITWTLITTGVSLAMNFYVLVKKIDVLGEHPSAESLPQFAYALDTFLCLMEMMMDSIMAYTFIQLFKYFLNLKFNKMHSEGKTLGGFNKFIILWVVSLLFLNLFNSYSRVFMSYYFQAKY